MAKLEYVNQNYKGFLSTDIRNGGKFSGLVFEAVVGFQFLALIILKEAANNRAAFFRSIISVKVLRLFWQNKTYHLDIEAFIKYFSGKSI